MMQIYQKCFFFGVFIVFLLFLFFSENLSKTWVKNWVATYAPPLYNAYEAKIPQCFA